MTPTASLYPRRFTGGKGFSVVLLVIGLALAAVAVVATYEAASFALGARRTVGYVTSFETRTSRTSEGTRTRTYPIYTYTVEGRSYAGLYELSFAWFKPGDAVSVWYDPERPAFNRPCGAPSWLLPLLLAGLAVVFIDSGITGLRGYYLARGNLFRWAVAPAVWVALFFLDIGTAFRRSGGPPPTTAAPEIPAVAIALPDASAATPEGVYILWHAAVQRGDTEVVGRHYTGSAGPADQSFLDRLRRRLPLELERVANEKTDRDTDRWTEISVYGRMADGSVRRGVAILSRKDGDRWEIGNDGFGYGAPAKEE